MKVKIDIDTQTFVRLGFVTLAFVLGIYLFFHLTTPITIIVLALILAIALNPPVTRLARRLPGRSRVGATAIAYLIVVAILAALIFLVVPPVIQQSSKFASTVPDLIDKVSANGPGFHQFLDKYGLQATFDNSVGQLKGQVSALAANLGGLLVTSVKSLVAGAVALLFILVLAFLMLIEGPTWMARWWSLYKNKARLKRHKNVVSKMYRVVSGYVNGQLIVAAIDAVAGLAVILILSAVFDMEANIALPLATLLFIGALIPMFGATVSAILVALVLLLNSFWAAVIFAIYFVIYQQVENNIISPNVQAKAVELSALVVLLAVLVGLQLFGLLGGIISIPIAGMIRVLVVDYLEHDHERIKAKDDSGWLKKIKI
ncbi:MAG TPA: AI-2E family transporter [Candidatus Saccharimonadales bacterium]|nr:AI-2E family transporter [Candidatus Saccharimonadales bacterium]